MKLDAVRELNREFLGSFLKREEGALFNLNSKDLIKLIPDNFVQTIYFDPPFSNNHMNDIPHQEDRKDGDYEKFIWFIDNEKSFLKNCEEYLKESKRVLKENGSIFLHLPWDLAYDVKPMADKIFGGPEYLKNEIIWVFRRWSVPSNSLQENHHTILWYVKNPASSTFVKPTMPKSKETLKRFGVGKIVSAVDKETGKRVPAKTEGQSSESPLNDIWVWDDTEKKWLYELDEIDENKSIPYFRSVWGISHTAPIKKMKMIGTSNSYPFEKPINLLKRLIEMTTSKPEDIVLDLFAGTGVTAQASIELNRKYILNEISHFTTLDIISRIKYKKLVPGLPLFSHPSTIGKEITDLSGRDFEFWAGYTLGGISDDSYRGADTIHGLDVIIPVGNGEFIPGEAKKTLRSKDEWYKLSSKGNKLLTEREKFGKTYGVVSTTISRDILHEMGEQQKFVYQPVSFDAPERRHLLRNERIDSFIELQRVNNAQRAIEAEIKKDSNAVIKKEKKKVAK